MPSLVSTSSSIKAFFAFDVIVAGLAAILGLIATSLVITRLKNKRPQYHEMGKNQPLKSTLATHAFLIPSLLFLCLEYATLAALVALQVRGGTDISITTGYNYSYGPIPPILKNAQTISDLSWTNEFAEIFFTLCLNGAVWLHSSHVTSNGTGVGQPSMISKFWNSIILVLIAVFGLAAWSSGLYVRDGGSLTYPGAVNTDLPTRALHITFRCIVIFSSLSVAIEVIRRWTKLNKNGIPDNPERPILERFTFAVVPLIVLRDVFIIVSIVMIYVDSAQWSDASQQALAFLLIIFGQLANITILFMVLWSAWSMGRSAGKHH